MLAAAKLEGAFWSAMWNRKRDEDYTPPRMVAPPTPAESNIESTPRKETIPMSTASGRMIEPHPDLTRGTASLGKSVTVKGQIFSREDLTIDGEVEGTIELQEGRLTVGPNGKVTANIKAREIIVLGTVNGNMDVTEKIDIRKEAKLVGDIKSARVVIEDGAFFKGSIDIVKNEPKAQAPKPQAAAPQPQSVPTPLIGTTAVAGSGGADIKR